MKIWREFIRTSVFIIGSTVIIASIIAVILFFLTIGGGRTTESIEFVEAAFIFVVLASVLPIAVFTVLTKYTFPSSSIVKRATFYGFCNTITAFIATVYIVSDGKSGPIPGFNLETLTVYSIPALICFFAWVCLAIKFLK